MSESDYFSSDDEGARTTISAPAAHRPIGGVMPQPEKRQPRATRSFAALRNAYLDTAGPEEDMPETPKENEADQGEKEAE